MRCVSHRPTFGKMIVMKTIPFYKGTTKSPVLSELVPQWNRSIFIHTNEFIHRVLPEDIIYIKAEGNYATLVLTNERKIFASKTLKHFSTRLNTRTFLRTHQSYLINILHSEGVRLTETMEVLMNNGVFIPVSRSKKHFILNQFKNH